MKRKKTRVWILFALAAALVLASGLAAFGYYAYTAENGKDRAASAELSEQKIWRFLVAGKDPTSGLCDVLMLCAFDPTVGRVDLLQLPRDTFAAYDDGSYCKLNGAMQALGGMEALRSFLSEALGLSIDRYLCMDLEALRVAVDALGGVEITLSEPMTYRDPYQDLEIRLPAGKQVLDGEAAEKFVRYRSGYADGDLGRLDAQKLFHSSFFQTFRLKASLPLFLKLASTVPEYTETDFSLSELVFLGKQAMSADGSDITMFTLPGKACTVKATGASYFSLSREASAELLASRFGGCAEAFDPSRIFRHHRNRDFCAIYDSYIPYRGFTAAEMQENGV